MREEAHNKALASAAQRQSQLEQEALAEQAQHEAVADQMRQEAQEKAQKAAEQRRREYEAEHAAVRAKEEELRNWALAEAEAAAASRRLAAEELELKLHESVETTKFIEHSTVRGLISVSSVLVPSGSLHSHIDVTCQGVVRVIFPHGVGIRTAPVFPGTRTGQDVHQLQELNFKARCLVMHIHTDGCKYDTHFFELADGRGWIHDFDPHQPGNLGLQVLSVRGLCLKVVPAPHRPQLTDVILISPPSS